MTLLGEICRITSSLVDPKLEQYGVLPHISPDLIESGSGLVGTPRSARSDGITSGKYVFEPGDVLYTKIRPALNKVILAPFRGICSADMYVLQPAPGALDAGYLLHYLRSEAFLKFAISHSNRLSIPKINRAALLSHQFQELPPIEEQRRIAAILDRAASLRTASAETLRLLTELNSRTFATMFGDVELAMSDPDCPRFGEQVLDLRGGRNLVATDQTIDSPYRVLKISAVTTGTYRPRESKPLPWEYVPPVDHLVHAGDLLMSRANTTDMVGASALVDHTPDNLALPDKVWRIVWQDPSQVVPIYMHALLQHPAVRRAISTRSSGTGGSMKNVSKAKLMDMPFPVAPYAAQQDYARRAAAAASVRRSAEARHQELASLASVVQLRAFSGQL